jgi:hypothetical protein
MTGTIAPARSSCAVLLDRGGTLADLSPAKL